MPKSIDYDSWLMIKDYIERAIAGGEGGSYLPLSGGTISGDLTVEGTMMTSSSDINTNVPLSGQLELVSIDEINTYRSFIGGFLMNGYNYAAIAAKNGDEEIVVYSDLIFNTTNLMWKKRAMNMWSAEKTILDDSNISSYAITQTGGNVTGTLILRRVTEASGTSWNQPALVVGGNYSDPHIEIDRNKVMAKADMNSVAPLNLNPQGGRVNIGGPINASNNENEIGMYRFQTQFIGMYASNTDAINNTNRLGWLGYNGLTYMTIKDEKGGGIWLYLKNGQYVGYSQPSGATYLTWAPKTDNADYLGRVGHRWRQLYAGTTTIATSDRNLKKDFTNFDERYEKFFSLLKPQLFKFKDGTSDRFHVGYIAQDVEEALKECGLTALDFAGFCKDAKMATVNDHEDIIVLDDEGNPEYEYALRYSEFIALNTHMIQKQDEKINQLEKEIKELKETVLKLMEGENNG